MFKVSTAVGAAILFTSAAAPNPSFAKRSADQVATFKWPKELKGQTVLFVGGHPDDEWGVAPLMADACIVRGAKCHFVVSAEANSPGCMLTMGLKDFKKCSSMRRKELAKSAALFRGTFEFFGWDDLFYAHNEAGVHRVIDFWAKRVGSRKALVDRFEQVLKEQNPTIVFALDPRHGSTCNPAHRATSRLLLEAVERIPKQVRPSVWLEQTDEIGSRSKLVAKVNKAGGYWAWPGTAKSAVWFDASKRLANGKNGI